MKLYRTAAGQWVGTQAEVGKKDSFAQVEVPYDKPGLISWLNEHDAALRAEAPPAPAESSAPIRGETRLNLYQVPEVTRVDETTRRLTRWEAAYLRDPASVSAQFLMGQVVDSLSLEEALAFAEIALQRVRLLTFPAQQESKEEPS